MNTSQTLLRDVKLSPNSPTEQTATTYIQTKNNDSLVQVIRPVSGVYIRYVKLKKKEQRKILLLSYSIVTLSWITIFSLFYLIFD